MASNEPVWNPSKEDIAPVRGRHRLPKQRSISRSSVLGVATMAAVGVGGVASAQGNSPVPISMPDVDVPDFGGLVGDSGTEAKAEAAPTRSAVSDVADAGELLRVRILEQAAQQRAEAESADRKKAEESAAEAAKKAAAQKVREAAAKKAAEKKAAEKAAAERAAKEEAERKAAAAASGFTAPTSNYTLTATYGQAGSYWSADHTGLDFAAPAGTPVVSVGPGEIVSAGWAGSYGYRIIVKHADGTETWYCHLSSMVKTSGTVAAGETIGRVGATGNVTGPHLHFEVRPGGGDPIDPAAWLREKGVSI